MSPLDDAVNNSQTSHDKIKDPNGVIDASTNEHPVENSQLYSTTYGHCYNLYANNSLQKQTNEGFETSVTSVRLVDKETVQMDFCKGLHNGVTHEAIPQIPPNLTSTSTCNSNYEIPQCRALNVVHEATSESIPDVITDVFHKTDEAELDQANFASTLFKDAQSPVSGSLDQLASVPNTSYNEEPVIQCPVSASLDQLASVPNTSYDEEPEITIPEFFKDRHILVTGATGFLGQGLVAKLLRSCSGIRRITLLIRVLGQATLQQRFDDLINKEVFTSLWTDSPDLKKKLVPMSVQFDDTQLGLTDDVYNGLADDVTVIIHAAATTRLVEALRQTLQDNVESTKNVLKLAKKCTHLKAFVYVSTAYSQVKEDFIKEEIPSDVTADELYAMADKYDFPRYYDPRKMFDRIGSPCAYMFSKRLAEHVVSECTGLPRLIVRPCILTAALSEPHAGWTNGYVGFNGLMCCLSRKFYRYFPGKKDNPMEVIPVDLAVNKIIAGTWFVGVGRRQGMISDSDPMVLNVHSSDANPILVKDFVRHVNAFYEDEIQTTFRIKRTNSRIKSSMVAAIQHLVPTAVQELCTGKLRRKRCQSKKVRNQIMAVHIMSYAFFQDRLREYTNCVGIRAEMTEKDREVFNTDLSTINWQQYILNWLVICRNVDRK